VNKAKFDELHTLFLLRQTQCAFSGNLTSPSAAWCLETCALFDVLFEPIDIYILC